MAELKKNKIPQSDSQKLEIYVMDLKNYIRERFGMGALKEINDLIEMSENIVEIMKFLRTLLKVQNGFYIKTIQGVDYIIFKGYAGLRTLINGTKYLGANAVKVVVSIAQKDLAKKMLKKSILISVISTVGFKVFEHLFKDKFIWSDLLSEIGLEIRNDLISLFAGIIASSLAAGAIGAIGVFTGAPLIIAGLTLAVGMVVSSSVKDELEKGFLEKTYKDLQSKLEEASKNVHDGFKSMEEMTKLMNQL